MPRSPRLLRVFHFFLNRILSFFRPVASGEGSSPRVARQKKRRKKKERKRNTTNTNSPEDPAPVGDDDDLHVVVGPIAQQLPKPPRVPSRVEKHALRRAVRRAKLLAGLADRGSVDHGRELLEVVHEHAEEERLVGGERLEYVRMRVPNASPIR